MATVMCIERGGRRLHRDEVRIINAGFQRWLTTVDTAAETEYNRSSDQQVGGDGSTERTPQ